MTTYLLLLLMLSRYLIPLALWPLAWYNKNCHKLNMELILIQQNQILYSMMLTQRTKIKLQYSTLDCYEVIK